MSSLLSSVWNALAALVPTQAQMLAWFDQWGYLAVFGVVFIETAGIPFPGETILLLAAAAAATGHGNIFIVAGVAMLAAILGDNTGYAIGRYGGRRVVLRLARFERVAGGLEWGEDMFRRHGGKTVFLARWTAGLRIFGAWIAGMTQMPWGSFLLWNALGGITWVAAVTTLGYVFGRSISRIEQALGVFSAITAGVAILVVGYVVLRRMHRSEHVPEPFDSAEEVREIVAEQDPPGGEARD